METVTISSRFQIVIPRSVRERLNLCVGQRLQVIAHSERLEMIPLPPPSAFRGMLRGMNTDLKREPDRL